MTPKRTHEFVQHFARADFSNPNFVMFKYVDAKFFQYKVKPVTLAIEGLDKLAGAIPAFRRFSHIQHIVTRRSHALRRRDRIIGLKAYRLVRLKTL
jgi:hypothetical protein